MMYLEFKSWSPGKFMRSVKFSFSIKRNRLFLCNFCLADFCCVLLLILEVYGIGLKVDFPNKSTS